MKKAFVTGASKGIGLAIAKKLLTKGVEVVGTYNSANKEQIENLLANNSGLEMIQVNLADRVQTQNLLEQLKDEHFNYIVNNAGNFEEDDLENFNLKVWDDIIAVHMTAPYMIVSAMHKNMQSGDAIVNVASTDQETGAYTSFAYSAAKTGLTSLTKSMANRLGPKNIRVNAVSLGWIETPMTEGGIPKEANEMVPLGRSAQPEEVANVVSFLLSEDATYVNGSIVIVDGGLNNTDYLLKKEAGL